MFVVPPIDEHVDIIGGGGGGVHTDGGLTIASAARLLLWPPTDLSEAAHLREGWL